MNTKRLTGMFLSFTGHHLARPVHPSDQQSGGTTSYGPFESSHLLEYEIAYALYFHFNHGILASRRYAVAATAAAPRGSHFHLTYAWLGSRHRRPHSRVLCGRVEREEEGTCGLERDQIWQARRAGSACMYTLTLSQFLGYD